MLSRDLIAAAPRPQDQRALSGRSQDPAQFLARILDTPALTESISHLQPELLNHVIQYCGLEECGALIAMATPAQLSAVFDLDLWRSPRPGADDQLDAERFGEWLDMLLEAGDTTAADTLSGIDAKVVTAALAQYVYVFDRAAGVPEALTGDADADTDTASDASRWCDIGAYRVVARRHDRWDSTVALLRGLEAGYDDYFHRVMRACQSLSISSPPEVDGLDQLLTPTEQMLFDCAVEREQRREQQGYVTPAQAAAFLQMSRALPRGSDSLPPAGNPIAGAYFREIAWNDAPPAANESAAGVAVLVAMLVDAGVLPDKPRALIEAAEEPASALSRLRTHLELTRQRDPAAYSRRNQELGYLANVLVAGCSIQARTFTAQEAVDAAFAVCSLGLDNWPPDWRAPRSRGAATIDGGAGLAADFLVERDLIGVFQVGWTTLYEEVCLFAATRLIAVLRGLRCDDREVKAGVRTLIADLVTHSRAGVPWRARSSFDVMAILDMPTWAALLGLVDKCPTIHGALVASTAAKVRSVSSTTFEFISDSAQIVRVREFMATLPERLR